MPICLFVVVGLTLNVDVETLAMGVKSVLREFNEKKLGLIVDGVCIVTWFLSLKLPTEWLIGKGSRSCFCIIRLPAVWRS